MPESLTIRVRNALSGVINPSSGKNIVAEGLVRGLSADEDGKVRFTLEFGSATIEDGEKLLSAAKAAATAVDGIASVSAVATAHSSQPTSRASAAGGHTNPLGLKQKPRIESAGDNLSKVKNVIAIASGKGGVGKSTIAANLAVALAAQGFKTGLMDADIYGPSLPTLFGLRGKPDVKEGKIIPANAHGVIAMSIGLLVDEDQALAWRGPMVMSAVRQLISDVDWGALDILLIDTPPGTGDTHLSLIQSKKLSGAIIVSTPQEMALADVRRGVALFRKTETPVIGIIENMAWLETPDGGRRYLFGEGGAERAAETLSAPFLGAVPLYPELREASDEGRPLASGDNPAARIFETLAMRVAEFIQRS